MKSKINLVSIIVLLFAIVLFISCGSNQIKDGNQTIKIGAVIPLSGNAAVLGDYSLKGLQLAVEEQNAKGGILGRKIELEVQDSKADPKEGVNIVKNMFAEQQKPFIIYSILSSVTLAIKPETEANKTILMSAVGTDKFLQNSRYTIRSFVAANTIGRELSFYLKDSMHIHNLTMFYSNNEFGISVKNAMIKYCGEKKINIENAESYEETSLDYKSLISANVNNKTECVYIAGVGKGLGTMLKQIRESGYNGKIISDPLITFPDVVSTAGTALKGIPYLDFAFDITSTDSTTKAFVDAFKNKFNVNPQNFSAITYDGARMLFDAVNEVGLLDNDKIVEQLNSMKNYTGVFGKNVVDSRNIQFTFVFKKIR